MAKHGILGISFDHMHMGDLLRQVAQHPDAEIAGIYDPDRGRMEAAIGSFSIPADRVFTDLETCLAKARADLAIICCATAEHANMVEKVAPHGLHILVEKPFAASVSDARRMIAAMEETGRRLAINWPSTWSPCHNTAKRLVEQGAIGEVIEVHYCGGNRGPLFHLADKIEVSAEEVEAQKPHSWWYKKAAGGGSLLDYLGYGVTMGTWFLDGKVPIEVTCAVDEAPGIEVDQHSITICRYAQGLSKFETRWGTFTDPWTIQPQPKCGFVIAGADGTISSYDYDDYVTVQTHKRPKPHQIAAPATRAPHQNPVQYLLHCLEKNRPPAGPVSLPISRIGQEIVDAAVRSAKSKRAVRLS